MPRPSTSRRTILASIGTAATLTVAGCSSTPSDGPQCNATNSTTADGEICAPNDSDDPNGDDSLDDWVAAVEPAIHDEVNTVRDEQGCEPLVQDDRLREIARAHSRDMVERDFFDHQNPDGDQPADRIADAGLECDATGENIAMNHEGDASATAAAEATVTQWMNSQGHRENILRRGWTHHGAGVAIAADGGVYYTQLFSAGCGQ